MKHLLAILLLALHAKYQGSGPVFIGIAVEDDDQRDYLREFGAMTSSEMAAAAKPIL